MESMVIEGYKGLEVEFGLTLGLECFDIDFPDTRENGCDTNEAEGLLVTNKSRMHHLLKQKRRIAFDSITFNTVGVQCVGRNHPRPRSEIIFDYSKPVPVLGGASSPASISLPEND